MHRDQMVEACKHIRTYFFLSALLFVSHIAPASAQTATARDGHHDFDFADGTWNIHLKRLQHPLTGSTTWVEFDGTLTTQKALDGYASLEEFNATSPSGPINGITVRLYNPQTRQWSIYWANKKDGSMNTSPQVGEFKNGRGEFYGVDTLDGKAIYVRYVWSNTNSDSPHFEQAFSEDGGKTWEVNWITDQSRVK